MSNTTCKTVVLSINIYNEITEYNGNINDELAQEYKQKYRHQLHPPTPSFLLLFYVRSLICDAIQNWEGTFCTNFIHESKLNPWQCCFENGRIDISRKNLNEIVVWECFLNDTRSDIFFDYNVNTYFSITIFIFI